MRLIFYSPGTYIMLQASFHKAMYFAFRALLKNEEGMRVAIVGAGISGLSCARELRSKGCEVTVFEQHHEVGGRIVTHDSEQGAFDYGAQFFTAMSDSFKKEVAYWRSAGMAMPWHGKLVYLEDGKIQPAQASSQRFVAVPGMGDLARFLALGLDVRTGYCVKQIDASRFCGKKQWRLKAQLRGSSAKIDEGPFDAVVVATPADAAVSLLKAMPNLASKAEGARHVPCWALMLTFDASLGLPFDGAWVQHPKMTWMASDASKPDREQGERWMVLAGVDWSEAHLKLTPSRARDQLFKAFRDVTGVADQPRHAVARLWRYAQSVEPISKSCLWDERRKAGACGDWFSSGIEGGGQIEHAYMSGLMLARQMAG